MKHNRLKTFSHGYDDQNRLFRKFGTNVLFLKSCSVLWLHNGWLLRLHVHVYRAIHFILPNYFGDTVTRMSFKMCGCAKFFHSVTIQNIPSDYQDYTHISKFHTLDTTSLLWVMYRPIQAGWSSNTALLFQFTERLHTVQYITIKCYN